MYKENQKIQTLPVYDKNKLLLLKLTDTKEAKEYRDDINKKYKEIYYDRFTTSKEKLTDKDIETLQKIHESKIIGNRCLGERLEKVEKTKLKRVWNEDIGRTMETETKYIDYEKKYTQELKLEKVPHITYIMNELLSNISNNYTDEPIKLSIIVNFLNCLDIDYQMKDKNNMINKNEFNLTEKEILELFRNYLSLLNIQDIIEYERAYNMNLKVTINGNYIKNE